MAGSGQPWYMPLLWPIGNLITIISTDAKDKTKAPTPKATSQLDLTGNLTAMCAAFRSFFMAYICIYLLYSEDNPYPAFGPAKQLSLSWITPIVIRDIVATAVIAGGWDYILYFSPFKDKLTKFKFNPTYPSIQQIKHDVFWTFSASLTAALVEVIMCYAWANDIFTFGSKTITFYDMIFVVSLTHWRVIHFWLVHRMMHPWKIDGIPDFGRFLYKHVHSLHHKSYNPTAFSGTNMHPVESTLYYSAALCVIPFQTHPVVALACIVDCAVGAWLGHDGFQWPGSGDYFHQLHHHHFDCNYGAMHFPLDKWFGTFIANKQDLKKIWGKKAQSVGKKANEKVRDVHPARAENKK